MLISIQALVFVAQPYFNEPGLERQNLDCEEMSKDYNDRLMPHTIRWAMTDQIQNPSPCFKDVSFIYINDFSFKYCRLVDVCNVR